MGKATETNKIATIQKGQIQDLKKRTAYQEVEIEKLLTEKVLDAADVPAKTRVKGLDQWSTPDYGQGYTNQLQEGFTTIKKEPFLSQETKQLDWDSLLYRIAQVGSPNSDLRPKLINTTTPL